MTTKVYYEINWPLDGVRSPEISAFTNTHQFRQAQVKLKSQIVDLKKRLEYVNIFNKVKILNFKNFKNVYKIANIW